VLLFGLDRDAARTVSAAFSASTVRKRYLAIVRGWPAERGEVDSPLDPVSDDRAPGGDGVARSALTRYRRLATVELPHRVDRYPTSRYSLLELEPVTGRRHQLRRHLARISHPVVGDSTYGRARDRLFATLFGSKRLLLACTSLTLDHPVTRRALAITAPPADEFAYVVKALGWDAGSRPSSRDAGTEHVGFDAKGSPPSVHRSESLHGNAETQDDPGSRPHARDAGVVCDHGARRAA
jgi:tRNA pseudouridine65 synthase